MKSELQTVAEHVLKTFADFDIEMDVVDAYEGFNYHHIHLVPKQPVRMHVIRGFVDDLRFALEHDGVHIAAPLPYKKEIAVTVRKEQPAKTVHWQELHSAPDRQQATTLLSVPLGISEESETVLLDFTESPHLLIGGRTGTGKSTFIHGVINSLILQHGPDYVRFLMVDSKSDSLPMYKGVPHLLTDPISTPERTLMALKWLGKERERRCAVLEAIGARDLAEYHATTPTRERRKEPLPHLFFIIDETADVLLVPGNEAEKQLYRLALVARSAGIHLILSTASAEPHGIPERLKANLKSTLSFSADGTAHSETNIHRVVSQDLVGLGAALFTSPELPRAVAVQTGCLSKEETKDIVLRVKRRYGALDDNNLDLKTLADYHLTIFAFDDDEDDLYEAAKQAVIEAGRASTSYLQRRLRIGYSRAARLLDMLEERGVIGPADGASPREILED